MEYLLQAKIESLKLAYELAEKHGNLGTYPTEEEIQKHLEHIFEVADKNFNYLKQGIA